MNELDLEIEREEIPAANCVSVAALQTRLGLMENARKEVVGVGRYDPSGLDVNFVDWVQRDLVPTPPLEVFECADEAALRTALATRTAVKYAVMKINGNAKNILVARKGRSLVWRGGISTFGGPNDTGMTPGEPLAIIRDKDITADAKIAALFQDGKGPALGRRLLNKTTSYIACRWDYNTTPRQYLVGIEVEVRNPVTGKTIKARPADWGPAESTNRVADLSDFAAGELRLQTNDICEVIVPLPPNVDSGLAQMAHGADNFRDLLVKVALEQASKYEGIDEGSSPLRQRIEAYWRELQAAHMGDFAFESVEVAWSAVFVSWCLFRAGASKDQFLFSAQHSVYIKKAIARASANPAGEFVARRITERKPTPGDIIHGNRSQTEVLTYEQAAVDGDYDSHCAVVVGIGQDEHGPCAFTIGGNETDSVRTRRVRLTEEGFVKQKTPFPYISVLRTT